MTARTVIGVLAFLLWGAITAGTIYRLVTNGPDPIVLVALILVGTMGIGIFGALNERRGGPR